MTRWKRWAIFLLLLAGAAAWAGSGEDYVLYVMKGRLSAVDTAHRTAVVEVPRGGDTFTVAGPLVADPVLRRNGNAVGLAAFRVGDKVTVRWRHTPQGHIIESLVAR